MVRLSWPDENKSNSPTKHITTNENKQKQGNKQVTDDDFAVLINAHFDSIPGSPGASDDVIGIACMLEVLRILAHGPALKHPLVLLFNGKGARTSFKSQLSYCFHSTHLLNIQ